MNQIELFREQADDKSTIRHEIDLFDPEVVRNTTFVSGDRDAVARDKKIAEDLLRHGHRRQLVTPSKALAESIRMLGHVFPNLIEAADYLADEALLALAENKPYRPMPVLLLGLPGMGKTEFANDFADRIGVGAPLEINFETAQTVSQLAGSERHWANSTPGRLFSTLAASPMACPVTLLEELDKATSHHGDPTAPLLGLLEERTAKRWHDLCVDWLPMNASSVIWIGSANDPDLIPRPVLSRFQVFEIRPLKDDDLGRIAQKLYVRQNQAGIFSPALDSKVVETLVSKHRSPRALRKAIRVAVVNAIKAGRRHIAPDDVPLGREQEKTSRRIGFI